MIPAPSRISSSPPCSIRSDPHLPDLPSPRSSRATGHGKKPHEDEISMEQAVMCLEAELGRPDSENKRLDADDAMNDSSVSATPVMFVAGQA